MPPGQNKMPGTNPVLIIPLFLLNIPLYFQLNVTLQPIKQIPYVPVDGCLVEVCFHLHNR